jgi:hypothetical protein
MSDMSPDSDDESEEQEGSKKDQDDNLTNAETGTKAIPVAINTNLHVSTQSAENVFRLQIMIELIRMHVIKNNNKLKAAAGHLPLSSSTTNSSKGSLSNKSTKNPSFSSTRKPYDLPKWNLDSDEEEDEKGLDDSYLQDSDGSDGEDSDSSTDSLDELFRDLPAFVQAGFFSLSCFSLKIEFILCCHHRA